MEPKFIELKDTSGTLWLLNVNHIISVEQDNNAIVIGFLKAGEQSTYGIRVNMTIQNFKNLIDN